MKKELRKFYDISGMRQEGLDYQARGEKMGAIKKEIADNDAIGKLLIEKKVSPTKAVATTVNPIHQKKDSLWTIIKRWIKNLFACRP